MKSTLTPIALLAASLVARAAPITWSPAANNEFQFLRVIRHRSI